MAINNDTAAWVEQRLEYLDAPGGSPPDTARAWIRLRRRRRWKRALSIGSVAAAACVVLAAFPAPRVLAARSVSACSQFMLGNFSQAVPAARSLAPGFQLDDSSGVPVRLSDFRGKVVLLNFWATWCRPCRDEIPWFIEFQQNYPDLVVLGVSLDEDGWRSVRPVAAEMHMNYRLMLGTPELTSLYGGLASVPTSFLIDRAGRIASIHTGLAAKSRYQAEIETALKETER